MPLTMLRQDITRMRVDAIVNADDTMLSAGGGVSAAIFRAAGEARLRAACRELTPLEVGRAAYTPGFALNCKYIIHTSGPVYLRHSPERSEELLRSAYISSLRLAMKLGCQSVAFPLISGGSFGYPKDKALRVALSAIRDYLDENELDVFLLVYGDDAFALGKELQGAVESYIDQNYVASHEEPKSEALSRRRRGIIWPRDSLKLDKEPESVDEEIRSSRLGLDTFPAESARFPDGDAEAGPKKSASSFDLDGFFPIRTGAKAPDEPAAKVSAKPKAEAPEEPAVKAPATPDGRTPIESAAYRVSPMAAPPKSALPMAAPPKFALPMSAPPMPPSPMPAPPKSAPASAPAASSNLRELIERLDEPFSATLLRLIDAKGKTDVEVYKRANIDRKLFSKIRSSQGYMPSKRTVIALAVALELSLAETDDLLERAGFALSPCQRFDVIIQYFITIGCYDIFEINAVLFNYDQPLLGA